MTQDFPWCMLGLPMLFHVQIRLAVPLLWIRFRATLMDLLLLRPQTPRYLVELRRLLMIRILGDGCGCGRQGSKAKVSPRRSAGISIEIPLISGG